jgi:hypothetical protein
MPIQLGTSNVDGEPNGRAVSRIVGWPFRPPSASSVGTQLVGCDDDIDEGF